jgi:prepilin-type N-terminal cleavage/methylation domain-containing protein
MSRNIHGSRSGFTLIELIAVIAIIAVVGSLSIPLFLEVDERGNRQALVSALAELNGRESMTWSQVKISATGWVDDAGVFSRVNTNLGPNFRWNPQAAIDGGTLHFRGQLLKLERESSLSTRAARWKEK